MNDTDGKTDPRLIAPMKMVNRVVVTVIVIAGFGFFVCLILMSVSR